MVVDVGVVVVNFVFDYFWIFGIGFFLVMGIVGVGWVMVIVFWLKVFIYLLLMLRRNVCIEFVIGSGF